MITQERRVFGELLRRHRLARGLTQEALAEQTGLSARGIADLERGVRRFPYPTTVKRLATGLRLTSEQLTTLANASNRAHPDQAPFEQPRQLLPIPPTSFVGRDHDLTEACDLLATTRLLTLAGPGGIGKTRLALALATAVASNYTDGVWYVDLAPLADENLVVKSVASVLGIRERIGLSLSDIVCDVLEERSMLLVLDNCEHVLGASAALAERLLRQCASVRILVTCREALRINGETLWRVPSLRMPHKTARLAADSLASFGATRLFLERARAVAPGMVLNESVAAAIGHICVRLDGLPLAIELAAARVSIFSVEQIAGRLDQSFRLLTSGSRTAPPRQQTLRAAIDWSYGLLPEPDKVLLDRLSIFAGGWTFEAAEAVVSGDGLRREEVLGLLGGLVDRSLVVAEPSPDGHVRYRLLEVLRQYGQQRLAERGQIDATRKQHADYFLSLVEEAEPAILGPDRKAWLDLLEVELDNCRAARRWFVSIDAAGPALRLAAALYRLWMYRGYTSEGRASLTEALSLPGGSPAARAAALFSDGGLGYMQADYPSALRHLQAALTLRREIGDLPGTGGALMGVGATSTLRGDADEAVRTADSIGFATPGCMALSILGHLHRRAGARQVAAKALEAALVKAEALDEAYPIIRSAIGMALVTADAGDAEREQALALLVRSVRVAQRVGNRHLLAQALEGLAEFAMLGKQYVVAMQMTGAADAMRTSIGAPLSPIEREGLQVHIQSAVRHIGQQAVAAALDEGRAWSPAQATLFAMELDRAGGDSTEHVESVRQRRSGAGQPGPGLTRREYEVARLVARGLSNRQVGQALVITEKTAKNHVQRVLDKLGINSRRHLIARASEFSLQSN
jgi:predicted ATPase/DNA-binding CsgD family transcriptional regulator/DNA-binding XRE family transcriptional regulator